MQGHALSPTQYLQIKNLKHASVSCKSINCSPNVSTASSLIFSGNLLNASVVLLQWIPLKMCCTTQSHCCVQSESVLKGSLHLSCWLTLSHTFFLSSTHIHSYTQCISAQLDISFVAYCSIKSILSYHIYTGGSEILAAVWNSTSLRNIHSGNILHAYVHILFYCSLAPVCRRVGDVSICLSDFTLRAAGCSS